MKIFDRALIILLCGFTIGVFLSLSIKYPLKIDKIDQYKSNCQNSTISLVWVGLDGDIYKVKCSNGKEISIHQDP